LDRGLTLWGGNARPTRAQSHSELFEHADIGVVLGMVALLVGACSLPVARNPSPGPSPSFQTPGGTPVISSTPSASPLLGHIAYIRRAPSSDSPGVIWVMKADGTGGSVLTDGETPAWSPDGKRIAFATETGRIHLINLDGSSPVELTQGGVVPQGSPGGSFDGGPVWSHDGTRIAFLRYHFPSFPDAGVYVMNADGSGIRRVSDDPSAGQLAWLARDQGIAFDADDPSVGPDLIHRVIVAVNPDGSNRKLLFSVPDQNARGPALAPDGVHFAFTISPVCPPGNQQCVLLLEKCQIMVAGSDTRPVQVTHEVEVPLPSIDPSAAAILGIPTPSGAVLVGDPCAEAPSWSPDSSKLVFDDMNRILVINADGSNRQQIANRSDPFDGALSSDHLDTEPVWTAA
jgi:Tol biopolymer transport system component